MNEPRGITTSRIFPVVVSKLTVIFLFLLLNACGKGVTDATEEASHQAPAKEQQLTYKSVGDLNEIKQHGILRVLAPQFDIESGLPRDGLPVLDYQSLVSEFAEEQGLETKLIFVEGFDELIPALLAGKGDVIVTNLTQTSEREKEVAFTRAITHVNEWLIATKTQNVSDLENIDKISIPAGTAYQESLSQLNFQGEIEILPSSTDDDELLSGITNGNYQASIFDSNIARALLSDYPELEQKITIKTNRAIGWATRQDNPQLLARLNNYLISHFVSKSSNKMEKLNWEKIKARGKIRMLTLNNPASYFMYRGELMGFDYELVKKFASENGLHLAVVIKNSIPELIQALLNGEGDVIAASLSESEQRAAMGVTFTRPYMIVNEQLVGRSEGPRITSLGELANHEIGVNPSTVFYDRLLALKQEQPNIKLVEFSDVSTENLITRMTQGEFDFTVSDSHLVAIEQTYHDNIEVMVELKKGSELVWMLRNDQAVLEKKLNQFIRKKYRGLFYNVVWKKYFENPKRIHRYQHGRVFAKGKLSPYDELVKAEAEKYHLDWRLLVSQMYQESKFNPKARSFAGAQGLMQVLPRTAKEFGYSDLYIPENGIAAGVAYMHWLEDRFSGEIVIEEKIYFILAAYNAGAGHVRDARKLATELGLNRNKWFANVEKAMLLLSQPKYYKNARFGYVRGSEPVEYVRNIRARYLGYLTLM